MAQRWLRGASGVATYTLVVLAPFSFLQMGVCLGRGRGNEYEDISGALGLENVENEENC